MRNQTKPYFLLRKLSTDLIPPQAWKPNKDAYIYVRLMFHIVCQNFGTCCFLLSSSPLQHSYRTMFSGLTLLFQACIPLYMHVNVIVHLHICSLPHIFRKPSFLHYQIIKPFVNILCTIPRIQTLLHCVRKKKYRQLAEGHYFVPLELTDLKNS